jgi:F-type H+-transporting ATPase subunit a
MGDFSVLHSLPFTLAEASGPEGPNFLGLMVYIGFVLLIIVVLMVIAKKGFGEKVFKNPVTSLFEQLYLFIENMTVGIIGSHGRKYIPMIMTLWMVIFTGNIVALFFAASPTADLSFNLGMALISVFYVQYEGMKSNGILGHFGHFAGPKLAIALLPITLMIFVIEIISELMKNVSLSLRLFGNMHGGHMAVEAMNKMGEKFYIPFGDFLLPIKLLTCVVQAMIFTLLTCVYLSLVTHHDDQHSSHGEEAMHSLEPVHVVAG